MSKIGLQLYSIREQLAQDYWGSLQKVKQAGYDCVEFAGFNGYDALELKSRLADLGLEAYSSHSKLDEEPQALAVYAGKLGIQYVIVPYAPSDTLEACKAVNAQLKAAVPMFADQGITVGYHNHWQEFIRYDGRYALEIIMDGIEGVYEVDTAWVQKAGVDPLAYIRGLGDKAGPIHAKDINADYATRDPHDVNVCIGEGVVDFDAIAQHLRSIGTLSRGMIVEQEAFTIPVFDALAKNAAALRKIMG